MTKHAWAQEIAERINCHGIGAWLAELAHGLDVPLPALLPEPPLTQHASSVPSRGLHLVLTHPHAGHVDVGDPERWELTEATFFFLPGEAGVWRDALPFNLDAQTETPASAQAKLGDDTSGLSPRALVQGDRRMSYFLDDARVVELTFRADMVGLERLHIVRLGSAQDYADVSAT